MPRVPLYPQDEGGITVPKPNGEREYLPQHRLFVWAKFGGEFAPRQAVLDTGAATCVFSKEVWTKFDQRKGIEWVWHPPGADPDEVLPRTTILSGTYPFRLGLITVQVVEFNGDTKLGPVRVLVQCTEDKPLLPSDPKQLPRLVLVGLQGVLNGRTLTVTASADGKEWAASLAE
jgi:hypothetical protein